MKLVEKSAHAASDPVNSAEKSGRAGDSIHIKPADQLIDLLPGKPQILVEKNSGMPPPFKRLRKPKPGVVMTASGAAGKNQRFHNIGSFL